MIYVDLVIILLYGMLAILSRKNFSKYKAAGGRSGLAGAMFLAMGDTVYGYLKHFCHEEKTKEKIRRLEVVSARKLDAMTKMHMVKNAAVCMGILLGFCLISVIFYFADQAGHDNVIERADYQGEPKEYDIYMNIDGEESVYVLQVEPVAYTEEEFNSQVNRIYGELGESMLNGNEDAEHICTDLLLDSRDSTGVFLIRWSSDHPEYVTSFGQVRTDELEHDVAVTLTAEIVYQDYAACRDYEIIVRADKGNNIEKSAVDIAGQSLEQQELNSRHDKTIEIPEELYGVEVSVYSKHQNIAAVIMGFAVVVCGFSVWWRQYRLKEKNRNRDNMLNKQYPALVNKLSLLLETGMTLKYSLSRITAEADEHSLLMQELEYTLREIDAGADEATAYEQLGARLALPNYVRIMNQISQNLRLGTRDLRKLMEEEVHISVETRMELARKKGEEASAKLVFPMIVLLVVIMVIIIMPAMTQF